MVPSAERFRKASVEAGRTVETLAFADRGRIRPRSFATPRSLAPGRPGGIRTRRRHAPVLQQESNFRMIILRYADDLKAA